MIHTLFVPDSLSVSSDISCLIASKSVYNLFFVCRNFPHSSASTLPIEKSSVSILQCTTHDKKIRFMRQL